MASLTLDQCIACNIFLDQSANVRHYKTCRMCKASDVVEIRHYFLIKQTINHKAEDCFLTEKHMSPPWTVHCIAVSVSEVYVAGLYAILFWGSLQYMPSAHRWLKINNHAKYLNHSRGIGDIERTRNLRLSLLALNSFLHTIYNTIFFYLM